jgi:hypothetical protein
MSASSITQRLPGIGAILSVFLLQSLYERFFCGGGFVGFWFVTAVLVVPAALLLTLSGTAAAVAACVALVPVVLAANGAECRPYSGGGAAMAYVPAILFGAPLSFAAGVVVAFIKRRGKVVGNDG